MVAVLIFNFALTLNFNFGSLQVYVFFFKKMQHSKVNIFRAYFKIVYCNNFNFKVLIIKFIGSQICLFNAQHKQANLQTINNQRTCL